MSIFLSRRSIRKYDENHIIPRNILNEMLEKSLRAPSSSNLQPNRILVIESKEAKELLRPVLYGNQQQLDTSSAMIVIFSDLNKYSNAKNVFNHAYNVGKMPLDVKDRQIEQIGKYANLISKEQIIQDGLIDGGLLSMQLMLIAKEYGYDTCPIGGFNRKTINKALNIDESLYPVLIISLGKALEDGFDTSRLPVSDVTTYL